MDSLGFSTRSALLDALEDSLSFSHDSDMAMTEHGVVNILHGLANMGMMWNDIRTSLRIQIFAALHRVCGELGEQGIATVILSMAKLNICWQQDLPETLKFSIRRAIARQSHLGEHALSSLLYGLGKLSRRWDDLHPDVRQALKAAIVVCHIDGHLTPLGVTNSLCGKYSMSASHYH